MNTKSGYINKFIHNLVAEAFIANADSKPLVDHIDGNRLNNNVSNLRWATAEENANNLGAVLGTVIGLASEVISSAKAKREQEIEEELNFDAIRDEASKNGYANNDVVTPAGVPELHTMVKPEGQPLIDLTLDDEDGDGIPDMYQ